MRTALVLAFATAAVLLLISLARWPSHDIPRAHVAAEPSLPRIAPAPEFTLTSQDGAPVRLADFRGKVVAVTFIFTMCTNTCPVLTPMMSFVQDQLGRDFGEKIVFMSITVDPERDTCQVLKDYAQAFGANPVGWFFLTGERACHSRRDAPLRRVRG